jgi:hypothetical protein
MLVLSTKLYKIKDKLRSADDRWTDEALMAYDRYLKKHDSIKKRGRVVHNDSERQKVYNAEFAFGHDHGYGQKFKTEGDVQKYLKKVKKSKTWEKLGGHKNVRIQTTAMRSSAGMAYPGGRIELSSKHGMNEYVLLHEMAHQCGNMHHDVGFRQDLLSLVSRFMGRVASKKLKAQFKKSKLRLSWPSEKEPEQWLNMYCRTASMRDKL